MSAVYMLWLVQVLYSGRSGFEENAALPDLRPREWAALVPVVAVALFMGVFPNVFLRPTAGAVKAVVERLELFAE